MPNDLEARFLAAFNPNKRIVHRICNSYFDDDDLRQDLFQEIVYQLWKSYPSFKQAAKFTTWMYSVALNTAITYRKNEHRWKRNADAVAAEQIHQQNADNIKEQKLEALYHAIHTLSDTDKAVVLLYLEDHSYDEIAAITGLTKTNVSVKLVRLKKSLEEKLKNKF